MVDETITNPTYMSDLPDKAASQLRATTQLTRFDDGPLLCLSNDTKQVQK